MPIARPICFILVDNNSEVEYELIPLVLLLFFYADRVANDAVVVDATGDEAVAKLLCGYEVLRR